MRKLSERPDTGGDIWLVDGTAGKNRFCNDHDVTQLRCRVWAHTVDHSAPNKAASGETLTRRQHPPRHPPWRKQKKEKSHEEAVDECCVHRSGGKHCAG